MLSRAIVAAGLATGPLAVGAGTANAAETATVTSPISNTVVIKFVNDKLAVPTCGVTLEGPVKYASQQLAVPPNQAMRLVVADVPAGKYSATWSCSSSASGKKSVTVGGSPSTIIGGPHAVPFLLSTPADPGFGS